MTDFLRSLVMRGAGVYERPEPEPVVPPVLTPAAEVALPAAEEAPVPIQDARPVQPQPPIEPPGALAFEVPRDAPPVGSPPAPPAALRTEPPAAVAREVAREAPAPIAVEPSQQPQTIPPPLPSVPPPGIPIPHVPPPVAVSPAPPPPGPVIATAPPLIARRAVERPAPRPVPPVVSFVPPATRTEATLPAQHQPSPARSVANVRQPEIITLPQAAPPSPAPVPPDSASPAPIRHTHLPPAGQSRHEETVEVRIGTIEVRGAPQRPARERTRPAVPRGFDDYAARRSYAREW
jgi:hypothetical protein